MCGARGCLERLCGGLWLERDFGQPAHVLMRDAKFVERYVVSLAAGLKTVVMLLNPARIVIGGGIRITVVGVKGNQVRIGVTAPRGLSVYRKEIDPSEETAVGCAKEGCGFEHGN